MALALLGMCGRKHRIRTSAGKLHYRGRRLLPDRRWGAVHAVLTPHKALPPAEREAIAASMPLTDHAGLLRMLDPACVRALARHPLVTIGSHTHGHGMLAQVPAELVAQFGFDCAMATGGRTWTSSESLMAIPRFPIGRFDNMNIFRAWACGYLAQNWA